MCQLTLRSNLIFEVNHKHLTKFYLSTQHFYRLDFLVPELAALIYFTHKITVPFLYFVEVSSQEKLLQILPQLFNDLKEGRMDTLKDYIIDSPYVKFHKPTADTVEKILCNIFSTVSAVGLWNLTYLLYRRYVLMLPTYQIDKLVERAVSTVTKRNLSKKDN